MCDEFTGVRKGIWLEINGAFDYDGIDHSLSGFFWHLSVFLFVDIAKFIKGENSRIRIFINKEMKSIISYASTMINGMPNVHAVVLPQKRSANFA